MLLFRVDQREKIDDHIKGYLDQIMNENERNLQKI